MHKELDYYCLHHTPAIERKKYMNNLFFQNEMAVNWICDFLPNSSEVENFPNVICEHAANKKYLNNAEKSLYLKHLLVFEKIIEKNNYSAIFEDDVIAPSFNLKSFCESVLEKFHDKEGDFVFLGGLKHQLKKDLNKEFIYTNTNLPSRCAHCYMINPKTAKLIFDFLCRPVAPFDWQLNYAIYKFNLKVYWTHTPILQKTEENLEKSLLR
jgi:GR25 family glycosyltransferase involved in LPS biosynthesis